MLETKWEIDTEAGRGWKYSGIVQDLFSGHETNKFEELLIAYLKENNATNNATNGMLFKFTLRQGFLPKHLNQILRSLQNHDRILVVKKDKTKPRKGAFYVNYKFYKSEFDKITIKLK